MSAGQFVRMSPNTSLHPNVRKTTNSANLVLCDAIIETPVIKTGQHAAEGNVRPGVSLCVEFHCVPAEVFALIDA